LEADVHQSFGGRICGLGGRLVKILDLLESAQRRIKNRCWKQKPNEFDAIHVRDVREPFEDILEPLCHRTVRVQENHTREIP
jgi:hypothetical protein